MKMGYMVQRTETSNILGAAPTSAGCSFYFYTPDGTEYAYFPSGSDYAYVHRYGSESYSDNRCFYMPGVSPESGVGFKAKLELRSLVDRPYEELCDYDVTQYANCSTEDIDENYFVGTDGHSVPGCPSLDFNCVTGCASGAHESTTMSGDCKQFGDKICCKN